jgi:hypothetical protein
LVASNSLSDKIFLDKLPVGRVTVGRKDEKGAGERQSATEKVVE